MARILVTGSSGFIGKHLMASMPHAIPCDVDTQSVEGPFDGIIHLAAVSRVRDAEADRIQCLETNIMLTARLLEWKPRWFIFASSCEKPHNVYGLSKRVAEDYIRLRQPKHIILRITNVYGPGMNEDKVLPRIRRGEVKAVDDATFPFEHIHVSDVCEQILYAVKRFDEPAFKQYTMKLATGIAHDYEDLVDVATSY